MGLECIAGDHYANSDWLVLALAVPILYARLEPEVTIGGLAQPGMGCCSIRDLFPCAVAYHCRDHPRWLAFWRIDIGWVSGHDYLGRHPVTLRSRTGICAGHLLRCQARIWSGAREMASRACQFTVGGTPLLADGHRCGRYQRGDRPASLSSPSWIPGCIAEFRRHPVWTRRALALGA